MNGAEHVLTAADSSESFAGPMWIFAGPYLFSGVLALTLRLHLPTNASAAEVA